VFYRKKSFIIGLRYIYIFIYLYITLLHYYIITLLHYYIITLLHYYIKKKIFNFFHNENVKIIYIIKLFIFWAKSHLKSNVIKHIKSKFK
jgi:hypothetical protein